MKTKEEMQAIVNEIREVCKLHGVVLLPGPDCIVLCEAEQVNQSPFVLQKSVDDATMMLTNKVDEHEHRKAGFTHEVDHFTIFGIGDVEGITKPRLVVSEYVEGTGMIQGAATAVDVETLAEVEQIPFVIANIVHAPDFLRFGIDLSCGPFGVLMAWYKDSPAKVVGFIEGANPDALKAQWPDPAEESNGGV